jgi:hypothetical protein
LNEGKTQNKNRLKVKYEPKQQQHEQQQEQQQQQQQQHGEGQLRHLHDHHFDGTTAAAQSRLSHARAVALRALAVNRVTATASYAGDCDGDGLGLGVLANVSLVFASSRTLMFDDDHLPRVARDAIVRAIGDDCAVRRVRFGAIHADVARSSSRESVRARVLRGQLQPSSKDAAVFLSVATLLQDEPLLVRFDGAFLVEHGAERDQGGPLLLLALTLFDVVPNQYSCSAHDGEQWCFCVIRCVEPRQVRFVDARNVLSIQRLYVSAHAIRNETMLIWHETLLQ